MIMNPCEFNLFADGKVAAMYYAACGFLYAGEKIVAQLG
jgi:hypothetical protein